MTGHDPAAGEAPDAGHATATGAVVRVPASSANLGPGFDVLGVALGLHAVAGCGVPPAGGRARVVDEHHPAAIAFARAGGQGPLWVEAPIPMGRGLGYSGAVRVAGVAAALAGSGRVAVGPLDDGARRGVVELAGELEGHVDNVAASVYGGVVVAAGGHVTRVPVALDARVVVWVPDAATTSTDRSRAQLPDAVAFGDAVFNVGRAALLVAALASGDVAALAVATEDRLHQEPRLARVPESADALNAGRAAGAWCGWLSGSGPSVALLCPPEGVDGVVAALPDGGHARELAIDAAGAVVESTG